MDTNTLITFEPGSDLSNWTIVNDVVMGGRSDSKIHLSDQGYGVFEGHVSLENNGGFASVKYHPGRIQLQEFQKIAVRLKGDGKRYQFRIKEQRGDSHSYVSYFDTTGGWQNVAFALSSLYPTYRGRKLDKPNFSGTFLEEISFLIGNNNEEDFRLEIQRITLQ